MSTLRLVNIHIAARIARHLKWDYPSITAQDVLGIAHGDPEVESRIDSATQSRILQELAGYGFE